MLLYETYQFVHASNSSSFHTLLWNYSIEGIIHCRCLFRVFLYYIIIFVSMTYKIYILCRLQSFIFIGYLMYHVKNNAKVGFYCLRYVLSLEHNTFVKEIKRLKKLFVAAALRWSTRIQNTFGLSKPKGLITMTYSIQTYI